MEPKRKATPIATRNWRRADEAGTLCTSGAQTESTSSCSWSCRDEQDTIDIKISDLVSAAEGGNTDAQCWTWITHGLAKVALLLWVPPFGRVFALLPADKGELRVITELGVLEVHFGGGEVSKRRRGGSECSA